jgi:hypothetical protein
MKTKTLLVTLTLWLAVGTACFASAMTGTWKLNEAKSKFTPGATKNKTVVYESSFFKTKVIVDGVDAKGKPVHTEWTGYFDGKDYAVTGDPTSDMRAYTKVDDHNLTMTVKKGGKVTATGKVAVAADGKTRTVVTTGTSVKGKKMKNVAVYDKQ